MNTIQIIINSITLLLVVYIALKGRTPRVKNSQNKPLLLDSSALIDGRILDVAKSGFLPGPVLVPSSVLREMQYLADNGDHEKRARARNGLDMVKSLQEIDGLTVKLINDGLPVEGGVDERLVVLSKKYSAQLVTLDFNLNKVAQAEGIRVLNINQLAQQLRMSYLPGEKRDITLVQKGQDKTQAVGYLEDGTMVVVENMAKAIGTSVEVEFTRAIQTQSGRMLFAKSTVKPQDSKIKTVEKVDIHQKPQRKLPTSRSRKQKRTPEDSLVELANKQ